MPSWLSSRSRRGAVAPCQYGEISLFGDGKRIAALETENASLRAQGDHLNGTDALQLWQSPRTVETPISVIL
jgi:hypothetical protein